MNITDVPFGACTAHEQAGCHLRFGWQHGRSTFSLLTGARGSARRGLLGSAHGELPHARIVCGLIKQLFCAFLIFHSGFAIFSTIRKFGVSRTRLGSETLLSMLKQAKVVK